VAPPRRLSSFVGRDREIAELRRLLAEVRLLTLVGAGGCGKTRLAIEVAAQVGPSFPAGVAFVGLAPIQDPQQVPGAVAAALGIPRPAAGRLPDLVGGARVLLLIDNAEHLVDVVSTQVERLLAACPRAVVLATSREALRVDGERAWRVPPMSAPPEAAGADPAILERFDAVRLFCARVAEQRSDFRLTGGSAAPVAAICRRLDGIPLALELAAARVPAFALTEIVRRLDDALGLLTRGPRSAVDRHRTLRATIDWSHRLLDDAEQRLFRRLSLFVGTFDLEAVEAVCPDGQLTAERVADVLQRLVDKSLVEARGDGGGGLRYSLVETIRQYARERLDEAGEPALGGRHARWYGALAARLDDERRPLGDRLDRMGVEYGNVRRALDWAASEDACLEAELIEHLRWFWVVRGSFGEAWHAVRAALATGRVAPALHAALHREAASWSLQLGMIDAALAHADDASRLLEAVDDPVLEASVMSVRGTIRTYTGDPAGAERDLEGATSLLEPAGGSELLARTLNNLVLLRMMHGEPAQALALAQRIVPVMEALRERSIYVPYWHHTLGVVLLAAGRVDDARAHLVEALEQAVEYGNDAITGPVLQALACVASAAGDAALSLELLVAGRRRRRLAGIVNEDEPGTPIAAAERASEAVLPRAAAARARELGARLDLHAALLRARTVRASAPPPLTPRKRQVVRLVAEGLTNREIARRLCVSERTVDAHLDQVRTQLGLSNRVQLAAWAAAHLEPEI
jgi:non-specific serine/threonine protein kinase